MAVGMVLLHILNHIGLAFNGRINCERSWGNRESRPQLSPYAISIRGEVPRPTSVPGSQVFKQVGELHGCTTLEVAVGPLIGHAGQGLQISNDAGTPIRLQGGGEAEDDLRLGRANI